MSVAENNPSFDLSLFLQSGALMSISPTTVLIGWGETRTFHHIHEAEEKPAFYVCDFFLSTPLWVQYPYTMEISHQDLLAFMTSSSSLSACEWTLSGIDSFQQGFTNLQHLFQQGKLKKAVPYLFAQTPSKMTDSRLKQSLRKAFSFKQSRVGYVYGHWNASLSSGILGVTPELLFTHSQMDPKKVNTMALAGTCASNKNKELFKCDKKERHEHQLVVEGIYQSLSHLGKVQCQDMEVLEFPHLTHLMTPIQVELDESFSFEKCVQALHPTPALGAFPIEMGKKWLLNYNQSLPRYDYGAPIGVHDPKKGLSQCLVAIRNVRWNENGMRIGAGCGVVQQSVMEKEIQEIELKVKAIRDALEI